MMPRFEVGIEIGIRAGQAMPAFRQEIHFKQRRNWCQDAKTDANAFQLGAGSKFI